MFHNPGDFQIGRRRQTLSPLCSDGANRLLLRFPAVPMAGEPLGLSR